MNSELKGKRILITGASGGIGSEIARQLSAEGAKLVLHCHQNRKSAEELAKSLPESICLSADLCSESETAKLFEAAEKTLGPIEILVANAGIWVERDTPIHEMSLEQWNKTLQTNLTSMFLCLREFVRQVRAHHLREPAAVLIGSTAGVYGEAGHCDYAASKSAAIYGLMLSLKNELGRMQGRINAVSPSWVITPMAETLIKDPGAIRQALQTVPLRKVARPNDVAAAVVFLCSSALSGHISGHVLPVAGGMEGRALYTREEIDISKA
jgi:3-oxoacyl-[acyl-carrier protein] reductase